METLEKVTWNQVKIKAKTWFVVSQYNDGSYRATDATASWYGVPQYTELIFDRVSMDWIKANLGWKIQGLNCCVNVWHKKLRKIA